MKSKRETIEQKLFRAKATFNEIEVLLQNNFFATAVNRMYYSCFYVTQALLFTKDLSSKTHKGVVTLLHQHFVNTGLFDKEKASFYSELLKERMEDDYSDVLVLDEAEVIDFYEPAKAYIDYVTKLVEGYLAE